MGPWLMKPRPLFLEGEIMKTLLLLIALFFNTTCTTNFEKLIVDQTFYPIRVFVFDKENVLDHRVAHAAFLESIHRWAKYLPVHFVITYENRVSGVLVRYDDLQGSGYNIENAVGLYIGQSLFNWRERIVIDDDVETQRFQYPDNTRAVHVCMHEIGHMLGLTHIVGPKSPYHRNIAASSETQARLCVMYPVANGVVVPHESELDILKEKLDISRKAWQNTGYVTVFIISEEPHATGRDTKGTSDPD